MSARTSFNIASTLPEMAAKQPYTPAIFYPAGRDANGKRRYTHYTYAQLDHDSDVIARGLEAIGITRGMRTTLMVTPSLEFFALTFAIFKVGAVPVLVDPGIGLKSLKACLGRAAPEAFIGIPKAHIARVLFGWAKGTLKQWVTVGRKGPWGGVTLEHVKALGRAADPKPMAPTAADEVAAILFTSGSTGPPKGAVYTHGTFMTQVETIRDMYDIRPGEVDLPTFPLFALFDPALGVTTVVPEMDFTKPAQVDPSMLMELMRDFGVTMMFGSPALLTTVSRWGEANDVAFPDTLKRVISAGAPMPDHVLKRIYAMLPEGGEVHPPYGATESLPVATLPGSEILGDTWPRTEQGAGVCVGRTVHNVDVRVIRIDDGPIEQWSDDLELPQGEIGEITVAGPQVTTAYFGDEEKTRGAKIRHADGTVRHRMGDVGYFDETGRLWFCGRKRHRVELGDRTLFTIPVEGVFNTHPKVFRSAIVGVDRGGVTEPVLWVELWPEHRGTDHAALADELRAIGAKHDHTAGIERVLVHDGFPVDIRHNAKINRELLAVEAARR